MILMTLFVRDMDIKSMKWYLLNEDFPNLVIHNGSEHDMASSLEHLLLIYRRAMMWIATHPDMNYDYLRISMLVQWNTFPPEKHYGGHER